MSYFAEKLREVINCHCRENASDTPDFILSEYLFRCLDAFDSATRERDNWHKFHPGLKDIEERPLTLEKASNSLQQLKAEILPLAKSIRICIKERKYQYAINRIDDIFAKLSAI